MNVDGARVLVTGANRGLGLAYARTLLDRGATVYAGARDPDSVPLDGVTRVRLDITDSTQVADAARRCSDVHILINNAAAMTPAALISAPDTHGAHTDMATNYFGTLAMCRAFAPVLAANGGGALVNVLSVVSWFASPFNSSYCASKSAAWALTNSARMELRDQGTLVIGVFASYLDTDMAAAITWPKVDPRVVADLTLDAIETGAEEVFSDDRARDLKAALPHDLTTIYPDVEARWRARV